MRNEPDVDLEMGRYPPDHLLLTNLLGLRRIAVAITVEVAGEAVETGTIGAGDEGSSMIVTGMVQPSGLALRRGATGTEMTATAIRDTSTLTCVLAIQETTAICEIVKFDQDSTEPPTNHPHYLPKTSHRPPLLRLLLLLGLYLTGLHQWLMLVRQRARRHQRDLGRSRMNGLLR